MLYLKKMPGTTIGDSGIALDWLVAAYWFVKTLLRPYREAAASGERVYASSAPFPRLYSVGTMERKYWNL